MFPNKVIINQSMYFLVKLFFDQSLKDCKHTIIEDTQGVNNNIPSNLGILLKP